MFSRVSRTPEPLSRRCLACGTALAGPESIVLRAFGVHRSPRNPNLCSRCILHIEDGRLVEVTALFADLCGFTAMTRSLGPEKTHCVVDEFLKGATTSVAAHDGVVDKYLGDALLAFFNLPLRREDHVCCALRCAESILSRLPELSQQYGLTIQARVGLATGWARAGTLGSNDRRDVTLLGDCLNLASRLQALAHPGEILMDGEAYARAASEFPGAIEEHLPIKGFPEPVKAFRLRAQGTAPTPERATREFAPWLALGSLFFALTGAPCAAGAAVGLGAWLLGGGSAVLAATGALTEPAGLDSPVIRLPLLFLACAGTSVNLLALDHARRLSSSKTSWAIPPTKSQVRRRRWLLGLSIATIAVTVLEFLAHRLVMHHALP